MIKINLQQDSKNFIDRYNNKMGKSEEKLKGLSIHLAMSLKSEIEKEILKSVGSNKAPMFIVDVMPAGFATAVVVKLKDKKAAYFYHGTKPHKIASSRPMPIIPYGNNGKPKLFAYRVNHPGTKSHKRLVNDAIRRASTTVRNQAKRYIRQGFY